MAPSHPSPSRTLRGVAIPAFLYGTAWKEERTEGLVTAALASGFVGIDTANQRKHYFEAAVGTAVRQAIAAGGVTRETLFLQSKFTFAEGQDQRLPYDPSATTATQVQQSFASTLEHFATTYLDSYVLHGPSQRFGLGSRDHEAWRAMEVLQRAGKSRLIGVSNVDLAQLEALYAFAEVKPAFVQNRCYARTRWDAKVRAFCQAHDIVYQGFSLLTANVEALGAPAVRALAKAKGCGVAALTFRFAMDVGMLPLTGTTNPEHMRDDLACASVRLTEGETQVLLDAGT